MHRKRLAGWVGAAVTFGAGLAACGQPSGGAAGETYYFVSYLDPKVYAQDENVLSKCRSLPGTKKGSTDDSYPPGDSLVFTGDQAEQGRLESCLRGLTNIRVLGPAEPGATAPPVLIGTGR